MDNFSQFFVFRVKLVRHFFDTGEHMTLLTKQHLGQLATQVPVKRMRVLRWRDLRLWAGLVIIVLAMFAGAFLCHAGGNNNRLAGQQ